MADGELELAGPLCVCHFPAELPRTAQSDGCCFPSSSQISCKLLSQRLRPQPCRRAPWEAEFLVPPMARGRLKHPIFSHLEIIPQISRVSFRPLMQISIMNFCVLTNQKTLPGHAEVNTKSRCCTHIAVSVKNFDVNNHTAAWRPHPCLPDPRKHACRGTSCPVGPTWFYFFLSLQLFSAERVTLYRRTFHNQSHIDIAFLSLDWEPNATWLLCTQPTSVFRQSRPNVWDLLAPWAFAAESLVLNSEWASGPSPGRLPPSACKRKACLLIFTVAAQPLPSPPHPP